MRKGFKLSLIATLLITMLANVAFATEGTDSGGLNTDWTEPEGRIENNNIIFESGIMMARLESDKPRIMFHYTYDYNNMTYFMVNFKDIIEYVDNNGNGVFEEDIDTKVKTLELDKTKFSHSGFYDLTNFSYDIDITEKIEPIEVMGTGIRVTASGLEQGYEDVNLTFVLQMYAYNVTLEPSMGMIQHTVNGGSTLKIDVSIGNWPFSDSKNLLAVKVEVYKEVGDITTGNWNYDTTKVDEGRIQLVNETGHIFGFFEWVDYSTVTPLEGDSYKVPVKAGFIMKEPITGGKLLIVYLCYPYFEGKLVHDPSIGLLPSKAPLPDLTVPTINLRQTPVNQISPSDSVTIAADASDDYSGVKSVELVYSIDNGITWSTINLKPSDGNYLATLDSQKEGTLVKYYVVATDIAGNQKISDVFTYAIIQPSLDSWTNYSLAIIAIVIVIVALIVARRG